MIIVLEIQRQFWFTCFSFYLNMCANVVCVSLFKGMEIFSKVGKFLAKIQSKLVALHKVK
jgi:hypothetical protein